MIFEQMEAEFQKLERGTPRLNAMRDAIHEADRRQDTAWRFWFRYDYLEESIFCGDRYYAMIIFPEMLSLYDEEPQLRESPKVSHYMLIAFRWIVEAAPEFPQVSRAEIDNYFRLFKRMLLEQGYSMNIYHSKRSLFYLHVDMGVAAASFFKFLETPLDSISDGRPLWYNHQVEYYLTADNVPKALTAAQPIFDGKMKSNDLPNSTYHKFCRYWLYKGDYDKAAEFTHGFEKQVNGNPYYMHNIGTLMSLYARLDTEHGIQIFNRNYPEFLASKNPWLKVHFLMGACHLFEALETLPDTLRVPQSCEIYPFVCAQDKVAIADWFYKEAAAAADAFDKRNGTDHFRLMLEIPRKKQETEKEDTLCFHPKH